MPQTATNPETGERLALVDGRWVPITQTATNPETGEQLGLAGNSWVPIGSAPAPTPSPAQEGEDPGFFTEAGREFVRGTGRMVGAYGKVLEEAPEILGSMAGIASGPAMQDLTGLAARYIKSATGYEEAVAPTVQAIRETGRGISESVAPRQIGDIYQEYEKDGILGALESAAVTGAGSLPGLLASVGTGLVTRSPVAAGTVLTAAYAPQEYEGIRQTQAETGFGGVDEAVAGTAAIMAMDTLTGIGGKILSSVGRDVAEQEIKRGIVSAAREVLRTGRKEAGTEAIQTLIGQVAGGEDPTTKESLKQIFESAVVGAVTGTAVGAPIEAGTRIARRRAEKPTEEQVAAAGKDIDTEFANLIRQEAILRMQENPDLDGDAAINQVMETEGLPKSLYDQAVQNVQGREADATDVTDDAETVPGGVEPSVPALSGGPAVESEATGQPELPLGRGVDVGGVDTGVDTGRGGVSQPALDIAPIQQPKIKLAERVKAAEPVAIAALDIVTGGQVIEGLNGNTRRSILSTAKNTMAQKAAKGVEFDPVNEVRAAFEIKGIALPEVTAAPAPTTAPEVTAAPEEAAPEEAAPEEAAPVTEEAAPVTEEAAEPVTEEAAEPVTEEAAEPVTEEGPKVSGEGNPEAEGEYLSNVARDVANTVLNDFMVGDRVRVGSTPGIVVGLDGDYVRVRPDTAKSPKAYNRLPKTNVQFVSRPDNATTVSASKGEGQDAKFGDEAGQLNADMAGLIQVLGANMYAANVADVSVKELLQNAFDAVKGAISGRKAPSLYAEGKIKIALNSADRTITVEDDARGMTPEIVRDAFFTVAGSDKSDLEPQERSGGLGLAKMGFMMGAEWLKLDTVRDGVRVTVDATSKEIAGSDFKIKKTPAPTSEHGTTVTIKVPKTYTDPKTGESKTIWFPYSKDSVEILTKPLVGPVEVEFAYDDGYDTPKTEVLPMGVNFPYDNYQKLQVKFDWGTADIYYGKERKKYPEHQVLSSGVYQFTERFKLNLNEIIPYDIIVNVKSDVDAKHPDYPFENSRERFKRRLDNDIKALVGYLAKIARGVEAADLKETMQNVISMPRVEVGEDVKELEGKLKKSFDEGTAEPARELPKLPTVVRVNDRGVVDTKGRAVWDRAKEEEKKKQSTFEAKEAAPTRDDFMIELDQDPANPIFHNNTNFDPLEAGKAYGEPAKFFAELGSLFVEMKEFLSESGRYGYEVLSPENFFYAGIGIDKGYGGVHIKLPYKAVLINPFYNWGARTLAGVRMNILNTMIHELGHTGNMNHGVGHNNEMIAVEQYLADEGMLDYFRDAIMDLLLKHESTFTAMRDEYGRSTTKNIAKSLEDYGKQGNASRKEGRSGAGREDSDGVVPAGGGRGGRSDIRAASATDTGRGERRTDREFGEQLKLSKAQIARAKERAGASGRKINKIQRTIAQTKRAQSLASAQVELGKAAKGEEFNLGVLAAAFPNLSDTAQRAILQLLPTVDVMRLANKKNIKGLDAADKLVTDDMRRFDVRENERLAEELETLSRTFKKNPKGVEALMDVMVAAVGHDVDPSLAPTPEEYAAKHDKKYQLRQAASAANPESGGLKSSLSRRMNEIKSVYAGLADGNTQMPDGEGIAGWTDLNPALKRAFVLMKKAHRRDLEGYFDGLKQRVKDQITDPKGQQAALAELDKQFKPILDNAIYFPMMRHGRFFVRTSETVGGKPQPGFYMFETNAEAQKFTKEMSSVEGVEVLENGKVEDYQKRSANRGADPLAKAINMLGQGTNASELRNELSRLYLSTIPGNSMKARFAKRKLRAGYSTDIMKSFMSARQSNKNARKSINFAHKLDTAISSAKDALAGSPDQQSKRNIIREIELRTTAELNPQPAGFGWDAITRLGNKAAFYWYLATPKSALIQLTQMHIVSLPMLAGKYGHAASTAALTKYGFTGLGQVIKSPITALSRDADGNVEWNWEQPKIINSDLLQSLHKNDRNMQEVLTEGWEEGRDTNLYMETFASDIVGAGETSTESLAKDGMTTTLRSFRNVAGFMAGSFHQMERVNREATYMAALELGYRKNIKDGMPHEEAKQKAIEDAKATTLEATFDFSEYNKPRIMTSNVGRLALQFYMYPVSMFSLLGRSSFGAIKSYKDAAKNIADPELRNKLIAQANSDALVAAGMLFNVALYGGLTALPFFSVGAVLTELFYQAFGDDEDFTDPETGAIGPGRDAEYWFRNEWIPGFFGPGGTVANALGLSDEQAQMLALAAERGPISALTNIDLTNSVALDFFWFVPEQPRADTPELQLAEMLYNTLGGAAAGVTADVAKSLQQLSEGEILKSIETAPRFIGNIPKAIRYKTEGQNTMADLEIGLPPEMYTNTEMFLQMAGFASTAAAKELESGYGLKKALQAAKDAKAIIREDAAEIAADDARSESNADFNSPEWQDVFERMLEHNRRYPDNILLPSELEESYLNKYFGIRESEAGLGIEFEDLKSSRAALREFERRKIRRENK